MAFLYIVLLFLITFINQISSGQEITNPKICGEILKTSNGIIKPPLKNDTYRSNSFCRWEISTSENKSFVLRSTQFSIEQSQGCKWDYLEVREDIDNASQAIGRFCGFDEFNYISLSSKIFIYFVSDELQNEAGFKLGYTETVGSSFTVGNSYICNAVIYEETFITSPGYPNFYPSSTMCLYRIVAPANSHVEVDVIRMSIADDSCLFDKINIYDGSTSHSDKLATLCGTNKPNIIPSTRNEMLIIFLSDYMVEDRGFMANIRFIQNIDKIPPNQPGKDKNCNIKITGSMNGTITSPGYPENYKSNVNCTMTIVAPVPDHQIMIHFTSLEIEDSKKCSFDSVSLFLDSYSDLSDIKLCGFTVPHDEYFSKEGSLKVQFISDALVSWTGFSANYSIIPRQVCYPRCSIDQVCVRMGKLHQCVQGKKCNTNICNNGFCVKKGLAEVQCFCDEGYAGVLCNREIELVEEELEFTKRPHDETVELGKRVLLECHANNEDVDYLWFYEDLMLQTDSKTLTVYPGGLLDIHSFGRDMEGLYKCLASTSNDFIEHEFRLLVAEPCDISIEVPPVDTVVEEREVVLLSCFSQLATNVTWFKDNVELKDGDKFKTLSGGQYLAISDAVPLDEGEYACVVFGEKDCTAQRSAKLSVIPASGFNAHCARNVLVNNPRVRMVGRITKGYDVEESSAPWHAILRMRSQEKTFCGGNLISKSWLITAAHCIRHFHMEFKEEFSEDKVDIYLGTNSCNGNNGVKYGIKRYVIHPKFGERAVYDNDVALIELDRSVDFNSMIQPVCLQPYTIINNNYLTHKLGRKIGRVIGCGQYNEFWKTSPEHLREVYVPYVDRDDCASVNIGNGNFTASMFCAGYLRKNMGDACFGDSGGSLTMRLTESHPWVLVGIVSWGIGCDRENHYGYYTHVAKFESWIQNYTNINN